MNRWVLQKDSQLLMYVQYLIIFHSDKLCHIINFRLILFSSKLAIAKIKSKLVRWLHSWEIQHVLNYKKLVDTNLNRNTLSVFAI